MTITFVTTSIRVVLFISQVPNFCGFCSLLIGSQTSVNLIPCWPGERTSTRGRKNLGWETIHFNAIYVSLFCSHLHILYSEFHTPLPTFHHHILMMNKINKNNSKEKINKLCPESRQRSFLRLAIVIRIREPNTL
jgi:hypothetical protein